MNRLISNMLISNMLTDKDLLNCLPVISPDPGPIPLGAANHLSNARTSPASTISDRPPERPGSPVAGEPAKRCY
jgi:hypothetical protein